jgi:hypothetical protein
LEDNGLWLLTTLLELSEMLDESHSEDNYWSALAARLPERLPSNICILIAGRADDMTVMGASSAAVSKLAALQIRLSQGPCIDCQQTGLAVLNEAVTTADERWPQFALAAAAAGFGIFSALPMRRRDQAMGVLFCAAAKTQLTDAEVSTLTVVARTAAFVIARQRDQRRHALASEQLQRALDSRVLIEQAKGAIAARLGTSPDRAFELLRRYARRENLTLADVSSQAIRNVLSPHDLMAAAQAQRASRVRESQVPDS